MTASPAQYAELVLAGLQDGVVARRHFPMLIQPGLPDISVTIHSHFLSLLSAVGQHLGFHSVSECPLYWAADGPARQGEVRADSVWFQAEDLEPLVAIEFERFESGDEPKLREKVRNLAIFSRATPSLALAVLVYWVRSGSSPRGIASVVSDYRDGFRREGRVHKPGASPLLIVKCVLRPASEKHLLVLGEFIRDLGSELLMRERV